MQSLGSSSKWSSRDSLSSTPSFLFSESDQTEDEADVFSDGEGEGGGGRSFSQRPIPSGFLLAFSGRRSSREEPCAPALLPVCAVARTPLKSTEGDLAFARKCAELTRYVRPLLELLNGLKTGRYERGLSTFQQSVAMDRLQRIVGILQKPDMGEKYLRTLLQVELMLKVWFPHLTPCSPPTPPPQNPMVLPSRWHQDQLHMPVKKRRLSRSDADSPGSFSPPCKRLPLEPLDPQAAFCPGPAGDFRERFTLSRGRAVRTEVKVSNARSICSPRKTPFNQTEREKGPSGFLVIPPPSGRVAIVTQDSSISSSTLVPPRPAQPPPAGPQPAQTVTVKVEECGGWDSSREGGHCVPPSLKPLKVEMCVSPPNRT